MIFPRASSAEEIENDRRRLAENKTSKALQNRESPPFLLPQPIRLTRL
jgi:hypothetical protein